MTDCPSPHEVGADPDGYCRTCGLAVHPDRVPPTTCSGCGATRSGAFCEHCGHHHDDWGPAGGRRPARWVAMVAADRRQFDALAGAERGFDFPVLPERRIELCADVVRIGQPADAADPGAEVDLGGPPLDPGVSREHAELLRQPDGSWAVRDAGSTNGTFVGRHRLVPGAVMPLAAGDRIRLGLWTRITIVTE